MLHKNLKWLGLVALVALVAPMVMGFNVQSTPDTVSHQCKAPWTETATTEICKKNGDLVVLTWEKRHWEDWDSRKRVCVAKEGPWLLKDIDVIKGGCALTTVCLDGKTVQFPKNEIPEGALLGACPEEQFMVKYFSSWGENTPIKIGLMGNDSSIFVGTNLHYGQARDRNGDGKTDTYMLDNIPGKVEDVNFLHYIPLYFNGNSWVAWDRPYWVGDRTSEFPTDKTMCALVDNGIVLDQCPGNSQHPDWFTAPLWWPTWPLNVQ